MNFTNKPFVGKVNHMAQLTDRLVQNIAGRYYVDSYCIDCDICRTTAPDFFRRHEELGLSIVHRQPETAEEIAIAEEALDGCPVESIGRDGVSAERSMVGESNGK